VNDKELSQNFHKQLKAFCLTHQLANLSKAGRELGMSQPAISLLIKSLEARLQTRLFERRGPKLSTTKNGEHLYTLALPIVKALDELPDKFANLHGNVNSGSLNIAAGESTTLYLLPKYISSFKRQYEQVKLNIQSSDGRDPFELLRRGEIDFLIGTVNDSLPNDISYTSVFSYRIMLITPPEHELANQAEISIEDIGRYPLIMPPKSQAVRNTIEKIFSEHGVNYTVAIEASGWEIIKKYVAMDIGIALVTEICLTAEDESITEISVDQHFPSSHYGIISRVGKVFTPAARKFIETMDKNFFLDETKV